jgi:hypothetical protein
MPALRRLDLRGGFTPNTRGEPYDDLGSEWLIAASDVIQAEGTGVAKVDLT